MAVDEPSLLDTLICDHRQALTLLNHMTVATAQGNAHAMELLAGALAVDVRLHAQARGRGAEGAALLPAPRPAGSAPAARCGALT